jgi:phenylpyruvate tautomerase PptA (4-oxalocrotonate tautomerase family)
MPFIDSKVSIKTTPEQRTELKERLGEAITLLPGKSESWLMIDLADDQNMYFKGEDATPTAFIGVNIYGDANPGAFNTLTAELTKIYGDVLGIPADHIYVKYSTTHEWGWNGNNF